MKIQYIELAYEGWTSTIRAAAFGDWAVHKSTSTLVDGYRVTHVPTGRNIAPVADGLDMLDALAIAQLLDERRPPVPTDRESALIAEAVIAEALTSDECTITEDATQRRPKRRRRS